MKRQFRFLCVGLSVFSLVLSLGDCASAPVPPLTSAASPTGTQVATGGSATTVPLSPAAPTASFATPTKPAATATAALSATAASKPTTMLTAAAPQAPGTSSTDQATTSTTTAAVSKDTCLDCHGPYDKLVAATSTYVAPSEEKITPHQYVPHASKEAKAILDCSNCHQSHPVPPTASDLAALPKPDVQWCYTTCHHENDFTPCKKCHK